MAFASDTYTDTDLTTLASHTGETGATWAKHPSYAGNCEIAGNRCRKKFSDGGNDDAVYYASGSPASADYDVQADFVCVSTAGGYAAVAGRLDTAANTRYYAVRDFNIGGATGSWLLYKVVAGAFTQLGSFAQTIAVNDVHTVMLRLRGTSISVLIDGTQQIGVTDGSIAAAGKAGVAQGLTASSTGMQLDNFVAADPASSDTFPSWLAPRLAYEEAEEEYIY